MRQVGSAFLGYLIGIIPTASWIALRVGIDLRSQGSKNPGANNALRLGGLKLAATVLLVEISKGAAAALAGLQIAGEPGLVAAGLGAAAGNLYNALYGFRGGKGLGITAGVLLVAWPLAFLPIIVVTAVAARATRSSDRGTLIAIAALWAGALTWASLGLTNPWGLQDAGMVLALAIGLGLLIAPRHTRSFTGGRRPSPA